MQNPNLNTTQKKALTELKESEAWKIVMDELYNIVEKNCDLNDIDDNLPDDEFKIEYKSRKLAKDMFTSVFGELHPLEEKTKKVYL